jgi:hypothetical protein
MRASLTDWRSPTFAELMILLNATDWFPLNEWEKAFFTSLKAERDQAVADNQENPCISHKQRIALWKAAIKYKDHIDATCGGGLVVHALNQVEAYRNSLIVIEALETSSSERL